MVRTADRAPIGPAARGLLGLVGFLALVEVTSGILQGYYTPLFTDIARHLSIADADVNWFEAAQLLVSALVVPGLSRLADLRGHQQVLLLSTAVTAAAGWAVAFAPSFWTFLVAWALMGPYVVWLPLEIAIIHRRAEGNPRRVQGAAAALVFALELGVIVGALSAGALAASFGMTVLLAIPAVAITLCLLVIAWGVPKAPPVATGRVDTGGLAMLTLSLLLVMGGLMLLRVQGPASPWTWLAVALGLLAAVPFVRHELRVHDPLVDLRVLGDRAQWPVQLTAMLFGVSVLGAQIPLSTFARTDPDVTGYGLGVDASGVSLLIGGYVLALALGALSLPPLGRALGLRGALLVGALLVALGYGMFLVNHGTMLETALNMVVAGLGSGLLVAALPAAAATFAPPTHTAQVAGMTNMTKTLGGALASSVFAICLASAGSIDDPAEGHAPFSGYLAVWAICSGTALVGAAVLLTMQRVQPEHPSRHR